jgi:dipeptidyl aminopeptidase/acylaminoacyl peptidase
MHPFVSSNLTAKLGMLGGSNGGLLMGAMITQHPDLMKAVVSKAGIYDSFGHGIGSSLDQQVEDITDVLSFFAYELGVKRS